MVLPIPSTTLYQRGIKLYRQGDLSQAKETLHQALSENPCDVKVLSSLGVICKQQKDYKTAESHYLNALKCDENVVEVWCNLGNLYLELKLFEASEQALIKGLSIDPSHALSLNNLASCAIQRGDYDRALPLYEHAYRNDPNNNNIRFNLSWALLRIGEFRQGFQLYESRFTKEGERATLHTLGAPRWQNAHLKEGERLALVCEQGFGDTLQFFRFISTAIERFHWETNQVWIGVQPELLELLTAVEPKWQWFDINQPPSDITYHLPIMSLPMVLGVTPFSINASSYISVPKSDSFDSLFATQKVKIGLCWQGSRTHSNDAHRSVPIQTLYDQVFKDQSGFQLYALQKGIASEEGIPETIEILEPHMKDFKQTANLIEQLDLVVTVDTSVAHLAAAMGKCVYILIAKQQDWRWFADCTDSPWYENVRLFRQTELKNWQPVYAELKLKLGAEGFIHNA